MKKIILSVVLTGLFVSQIFAQSSVIPATGSEKYEQMKAEGKINGNAKIINLEGTAPKANNEHPVMVHKMPAGCSTFIPGGIPAMGPNDDGSSNLINLPFTFCFYGTNYTSCYINNNGNISFGTAYGTFSSNPFPDPNFIMVAPFWADVDTRGTGTVLYTLTSTYMIVTWQGVGYYSMMTDKVNTFQLIITDGLDPILPTGNNIGFNYGDMQWTTGAASGGVNGFGGTSTGASPATVGLNKGDGINYIQMGRFDSPGLQYDGGYGGEDGVDWLDNQSFYFNACSSTNIAPISSGLNNCDTINICASGDTLILNGLFLAPEIGQTTSLGINLNGMPGATILSNTSGNSANGQVQIISSPANAGYHLITFTATDNGTPAATTVINVNVFVDTTGLAGFNPNIAGNFEFCEGSQGTLSVTPATFDSYIWNTGETTTSIQVDSSGQYWVTSVENGCYKTNVVDVIVNPSPTPLIAGYAYACGGSTNLYSDSLIYASYSWSNASTNDSINVGFGTYTLTVTDTNGCTGVSAPVTVTAPVPPVISGVTAFCNGDSATLTTTINYATYNWSTGSTNHSITVGTSGPYTVTVVDINGCTITSAPFAVSPFNYSLTAGGITSYCSGNSILLTAAANPPSGANYSWTNGSSSSTASVNTGGNITVTLTYANGCTADTTMTVPAPVPAPTPVILGTFFTCNADLATIYVDSSALYSSITWSNSSTNDTVVAGSGTYFVTVSQNGCSSSSAPVTIVNANPLVDITGTLSFCPGDSSVLVANASIPAGANYMWSTLQDTTAITVNSDGDYFVTVSYSNGCSAADTVTVSQFSKPSAAYSTSPPDVIFLGNTIQFTDASLIAAGNITNWYWHFGDSTGSWSFLEDPSHLYASAGTYTIIHAVQSENGCWDTISGQYNVITELQIPNVFTPNGDGKNDLLAFRNIEYFPGTALTVFNRWGSKVYTSTDYHNDWNGGGHSEGVYYFVLEGPELKEPKYGYVQIINQ
ncbi:MAG TPA: nidogen-like domain-containing protein [Bacteroidia bacterium]|jgi:gliding motility-associated-like protein